MVMKEYNSRLLEDFHVKKIYIYVKKLRKKKEDQKFHSRDKIQETFVYFNICICFTHIRKLTFT